MSFRTRLILLVSSLLVVSVVATTLLLSWVTREGLLDEARIEGERIAAQLARSVGLSEHIPHIVEDVISEQMIAQATLLSHFVTAAGEATLSPGSINNKLQQIADATTLDKLWVNDEKGTPYLWNSTQFDSSLDPTPEQLPHTRLFRPLLIGDAKSIVPKAHAREFNDQNFKYIAVTGVDRGRIAAVGYRASHLDRLTERIGLQHTVSNLLDTGGIDAIWVFDESLNTITSAVAPSSSDLAESAI